MTGPIDDLHVLYDVGNKLVNSDAWPNWYKGKRVPRPIRDKSLAGP